MTRYIIIGAGAIGGTLAARLTQHHIDVVAVARGAHGEAIATDGLTLSSPDDTVTVHPPVAATPSDVRLTPSDVLVLAVKTQQAGAALAEWADVPVHSADGRRVGAAGELLPVVTALNGVHAEVLAARYFATVVGACVLLPAVFLEPGKVIVRIAPVSGGFILGSPVTGARQPEAIDRIERNWTAATFDIAAVPNVMDWKYTKLMSNLANTPQALLGPSADGLTDVVERVQGEAARVLDAAGIARVEGADRARMRSFISRVRPTDGEPDDVGGSTWQSLMRGAGLESDYLNGEIVSVAHRFGQRAPVNAAVARLARIAASGGHRPGDMHSADLMSAFDAAERAGHGMAGNDTGSPVAE